MHTNSNSSFFHSVIQRIIANMLLVISLLILFTYKSQEANAIDAATAANIAKEAWEVINNMGKDKPKLLLRYEDERGVITQKLLKWNTKRIDPSKGPFNYVYSNVDKMLEDKDISRCKMQYYDDGEAYIVNDDDSILEILEEGPDMEKNKRLIGIICDAYPERADRETGPEIANRRYIGAKNAYDFAVMTKTQPDEQQKNVAEKQLKEANLGQFDLKARGVSIIDVNGDDFLDQALNIANAFKWTDETKAIIGAVPFGSKAFESQSYVQFDAANWKIIGSFVKLAGWKSDEVNNKYTMYAATSKFEFTIPRGEREGNLADRYLGAEGGAVSQEYMEHIKTVLQFKAIEASRQDIQEPDPKEWIAYDNKTDL
mmetsp:Transcript_74515/g.67012  ORF Transcript_74515/g.67012 Transcript_74515/m.67012 type:complete len:371 (+) Transcript_74515:2-1114(+)